MRKSLYFLLCTAALASLAGCNKFDETDTAPEPGNGSLIKVYAVNPGDNGTRANINVGESTFTAEWEAEDALGILPVKDGAAAPSEAAAFTYNTADAAFSGTLKDFASGGGKYYAFHPHAKVTGTTANIPFGNLRTQAGNDFNSEFDALVAEPAVYTADDTEAGKIDGKPVTFTLHRLTSILNFSIGGSKTDKVKYLLLTSGTETQKLSASSLDFSLENGSAATAPTLNTADQSNVIAVGYETGSEPAANAVDALINVPAGNYDNLTLDVITEDKQIGSVTVQRNDAGNPFVAGTLYKKEVTDMTFSTIAAPSLVWPDQDMDEPHDITKCGTDYEANIQITVPGGIAGLMVNITSDVLNEMSLSELDLFNNDLGLPGMTSGTAIQYQKSTTFDITTLVPLIAQLNAAPGSEHIFEVVVTDLAGQQTIQKLTFFMPSPITYNKDADPWLNTASFTLKDIPADATSVTVQYKKSTETTWQDAEVSSDNKTASIKPEWEDKTAADWTTPNTVQAYSRIKAGTGIFANNTYDYKLTVDTEEYSGQFSTAPGDIILNGDMEDSSLPCFNTSENSEFWGSGNNDQTPALCTQGTEGDNHYAILQSINKFVLAAGNLFSGTFKYTSAGLGGTGAVNFGQKYLFKTRPTALQVKYRAKIEPVDLNILNGPLAKDTQDKARIFVAIVDWTAQHTVSSTYVLFGSSNGCVGAWDPETTKNPGEGQIIGYGSLWLNESTSETDWQNAKIQIQWYDQTAKPADGNYSLVISCAANAYGDYMNGCSKNYLHIDDIQWVY